jgi:amino acid permease
MMQFAARARQHMLTWNEELASIFSYAAPIIFVIAFIGWKVIHRKRWVEPSEAQLFEGLEEVEAHEQKLALLGLDTEIGHKWYRRLARWLF